MRRKIAVIVVVVVLSSFLANMRIFPMDLSENLIYNGDFEEIEASGNMPAGWWEYWGKNQWLKENALVKLTEGYEGSRGAKISSSQITQKIRGLEPGAYYAVKARIKTDANVNFKVEYMENGEEVWRRYTSTSMQKIGKTNGQWMEFITDEIIIGTGVTEANFHVLVSGGDAYIDEICLYKSREPDRITLSTDKAIYYTEDTGNGIAIASTAPCYDYSDAKVIFSLWDDERQVLLSETVLGGGEFKFEYPLSLLLKPKTQYTVKAELYDAEDALLYTDECRIFKYDRPTKINEKNNFIVKGEIYHPIMMMGLGGDETLFAQMKASGINTVFCSAANLDACRDNGLMGIVYLYGNMLPAGHPNNIANTRRIVEKYQGHEALLGWAIMDEPFGANACDPEDIINSYTCIRDIDKATPIIIVESTLRKEYAETAAKYCDVLSVDPYPNGIHSPATYISEFIGYAREAVNNKKPVFATLQAFLWGNNYFPSSDNLRSGIYQSFLEGSQGVAYYCFKNAYGAKPLDQTSLWDTIVSFSKTEADLTFEHFVDKHTPPFNEYRGKEMWIHSYVKEGEIYLIALNRSMAASVSQGVPLYDYKGKISIDGFSVQSINDADKEVYAASGNVLSISLPPGGVKLYKITPSTAVDFSGLSWEGFTEFSKVGDEGANILSNPGFETGAVGLTPIGWNSDTITNVNEHGTANTSGEEACSGNLSAKLTYGGGVQQSVYLTAGKYKFAYRYKGARPTLSIAGKTWETPDIMAIGRICNINATEWEQIKGIPWAEQSIWFDIAQNGTYNFRVTHQDSWQGGTMPLYLDDLGIRPAGNNIHLYNKYTYGDYSALEPIRVMADMDVPSEKKLNATVSQVLKADYTEVPENIIIYTAQYAREGDMLKLIRVDSYAPGVPLKEEFMQEINLQADVVKAFMWSKEGMKPFFESKIFT